MSLAKRGAQSFGGNVGVDLRGGEGFVAQHVLDGAQICSAFHKMSRHSVTQPVRPKVGGVWFGTQVGVNDSSNDALIDATTTLSQKEGLPGVWPDPFLTASNHVSMARSAGAPMGTVRSLSPLPVTFTVWRDRSTSPRSRPHSSPTRSPPP